ncbi:MAG: response regulator transcription factor [Bacteroidetes bacterium]|nr:response regulator transcription factor [Bacteroidota bacterium]
MTCIIVDDEPLAREGLEMKVAKMGFLELVGQFYNGLDANRFLAEQPVDLVFLDIQMPDITGLELLRTLKNPPLVIFTTAFPQFALDSYELDAIDYLLKPIDFQRFVKAVNKAREIHDLRSRSQSQVEGVHEDSIFIRADRQFIKVFFKEIRYLEGMRNYVMFHTLNGKIMTAISLQQALEFLPKTHFARVNKSYVVNVDYVRRVQQDFILLDNSFEVPFGSAYQEEFIRNFVKGNLLERK